MLKPDRILALVSLFFTVSVLPVFSAAEFGIVRNFGNPLLNSSSPSGKLLEGRDGFLYGTSRAGGEFKNGTIYRMRRDGPEFGVVFSQPASPLGAPLQSPLVEDSDGALYGTTTLDVGTVYRFNKSNSQATILKTFPANPQLSFSSGLLLASDGKLYGVGTGDNDTLIYRLNRDGSGYQSLRAFKGTGGAPRACRAPLIEGSDGLLYSASRQGGDSDKGSVYRIAKDGTGFSVILSFAGGTGSPRQPSGGVTEGSDGLLYGALAVGSSSEGDGALFSMSKTGVGVKYASPFTSYILHRPVGELIEGPDGRLIGASTANNGNSGLFAINKDFTGLEPLGPGQNQNANRDFYTPLLASDGRLYCVDSREDGASITRVTPGADGVEVLHSFSKSGDEATPFNFTEGRDRWIYGISLNPAPAGFWKIRRDGTEFRILRMFQPTASDPLGGAPTGPLHYAADGYIYSTVGSTSEVQGGAVVRLSPQDGSISTVTRFPQVAQGTNPEEPYVVIMGSDGLLYGATSRGGKNGWGTVFRVTSDGTGLTALRDFTGNETSGTSGFFELPDGRIYGGGGSQNYSLNKDGSDYRSYDNGGLGFYLVKSPDGWFYGSSPFGGSVSNHGIVKRFRPDGSSPGTVKVFDGSGTGAYRPQGLAATADGLVYGVTELGGTAGLGVLYRVQGDGTGYGVLRNFSFEEGQGATRMISSGDGNVFGLLTKGGKYGYGAIFRYGESNEITVSKSSGEQIVSGGGLLDFGTHLPGGTVPPFTLSVKNTGTLPLVVSGVSIDGANASDFEVTPRSSATLAPGGETMVMVRFTPRLGGIRQAVLRVLSDDYDESSFDVPLTAFVPAPEIEVHTESASGAELQSGQTIAVDFGETRQPLPVTRRLVISNKGGADLQLRGVTLPDGYTFTLSANSVAAGAAATLDLTLIGQPAGSYSGNAVIQNDDPDEESFTFPVTGLVVTPEIALHNGGSTAAPEISSGQTAPVDFGKNIQGTPGSREITVSNTGSAPLVVDSITLPDGFQLAPLSLPASLTPGQSLKLTVSLTSVTVGPHPGTVTVGSDDLDEGIFTFPVTGEVYIPDPVLTVPSTSTTLNRQTGLREQTIHVANDTTATVPGYRILLSGLPAGVIVKNATEVLPDGTVVVRIPQVLTPQSAVDFVLEYGSANRLPVEISPQWMVKVELETRVPVPPNAAGTLAIDRVLSLADGSLLLEFASRAGAIYEMQYSLNGNAWKTSPVLVQATGNRTQWIDRGPPRTDATPTQDSSRFYRVREKAGPPADGR